MTSAANATNGSPNAAPESKKKPSASGGKGNKRKGESSVQTNRVENAIKVCAGELAILSPKERGAVLARLAGAFDMYPKDTKPKAKAGSGTETSHRSGGKQVKKEEPLPDNVVVGETLLGRMLDRTTSVIRHQTSESKPSVGLGRLHDHLMVARTWARARLSDATPENREEVKEKVVTTLGGPITPELDINDVVAKTVLIVSIQLAEGRISSKREEAKLDREIDKVNHVIQCVRHGDTAQKSSDEVRQILESAADPEKPLWETRSPSEATAFDEARSAKAKARKEKKKAKSKTSATSTQAKETGKAEDASHLAEPAPKPGPSGSEDGKPTAKPTSTRKPKSAPKRTRSSSRAKAGEGKKPKASPKSPPPNQAMDQS